MADGRAPARAALAGNPSDGYRGAVLAVALPQLESTATAVRGSGVIEPENALVSATVTRFARLLVPDADDTDLRWSTTIPLTVGLGGSSAIVIAALRALCSLYGAALEPAALAAFALAVEVEDLGIAAGLQDRVAQAYGGLTFMDFAPATPRYETLDPSLLPPLVVAWREDSAAPSGVVHGDLRERFDAGETRVRAEMASLARRAHDARAALLAGDNTAFARCVQASFDARQRMLGLDPRHVEMIAIARGAGAGANYTGSGGAIVAVCADAGQRDRVAAALQARACSVLAL